MDYFHNLAKLRDRTAKNIKEETGFSAYSLGVPLGDKSLYSIRSRYWNSRHFFVQAFPMLHFKRGVEFSKYRRDLIKRYRYLIRYFIATIHNNRNLNISSKDRIFIMELKETIQEIGQNRFNIKQLIPLLDREIDFCSDISDVRLEPKLYNFYQFIGDIITDVSLLKSRGENYYYFRRFFRYMILPIVALTLFLVISFFFFAASATFR